MNGGDAITRTTDQVPGAPDTTSGSDEREARALRDPVMSFDLRAEIDRLTGERSWGDDGKNSIVLAKGARMRVLLTVMRAGTQLGDDDAEGPMTVQVLGGRVVARRDTHGLELADGNLATIEAGGSWAVEAVQDSAVLITITWPAERAGV